MKTLQQIANSVARQYGCGRATEIRIGKRERVSHTRYGYRKFTTGEFVPNAYLRKFGWKNTYYSAAETVVTLTVEQARTARDWEQVAFAMGDGC